jgi:hypothetical protein
MNNFSRLYPEPDGLEWCKKLEFQISLVGARLIVPLAIEIAHYLYLHRRESCIRQGAKEADVMVLPMDMCDYDAHSGNFRIVCSSVADPDPPDPHVFGPPGSGSTSQRYGSGSFYNHAKIVRKALIPTIL